MNAGSSRGSLLRPRLLVPVLAVVLTVAVGVAVLLGMRANRDDVAPDGQLTASGERASIMAEAARLTTLAMSWRAAHATEDQAAAEAVMTPRMRTAYEKTLPAADQLPTQAANEVAVTAVIAPLTASTEQPRSCTPQLCAVSLVSATEERVKALLFVDQNATSRTQKKTVLSPTWELVTLVRHGDGWLIDEMVAP